MAKNRTEMTTREYLEYIPTEVKNGFLAEEDLDRLKLTRYITADRKRIYTSLNECAEYLLSIVDNNPGKDLYLTQYDCDGEDYPKICFIDEESDDEYTTRLCDLAEIREDSKNGNQNGQRRWNIKMNSLN